MRVPVVGASAVSAWGLEWRGLFAAIRDKKLTFAPSRELADSFPGTLASEVPPIAPADDAGDARARKLMSRPARLAAIAMRKVIDDAGWRDTDRSDVGCYMGVGASGVNMAELPPLLAASLDENGLDLHRFGRDGLNAINPLFAFQTMNNFTLCHGAILEGLGGPNAAFFSRGQGTATALREAVAALDDGVATRVIAGAADSALHPVTWSQFDEELVPGEGAAFLALAATCERPLAFLQLANRSGDLPRPDLVVTFERSCEFVTTDLAPVGVVDAQAALGESLAAVPALGWVIAVDAIVSGAAKCVWVASSHLDSASTLTAFEAPGA